LIPKTILNTFALTVAEYAASSQLIQITWRLEEWVEQARVVQLRTQRKTLAVPLCRGHHTERGSLGNEKFENKNKTNVWRDAFRLLRSYFAE